MNSCLANTRLRTYADINNLSTTSVPTVKGIKSRSRMNMSKAGCIIRGTMTGELPLNSVSAICLTALISRNPCGRDWALKLSIRRPQRNVRFCSAGRSYAQNNLQLDTLREALPPGPTVVTVARRNDS